MATKRMTKRAANANKIAPPGELPYAEYRREVCRTVRERRAFDDLDSLLRYYEHVLAHSDEYPSGLRDAIAWVLQALHRDDPCLRPSTKRKAAKRPEPGL